MKKICSILLSIALVASASSAFATGNHNPPPPSNPPKHEQSQGQNQGQVQGQAQGQIQGQVANGGHGGNASATGGNSSSSSNSDSHAVGISGGSFGGSASQSQSQSASADNSGNNTGSGNVTQVTVEGDTYKARRIPVSTAYAASLTSGIDTCLGSASGGVQLPVVGVSLGKTTKDEGCKLIKETHLLREFGTTEFERAACFRARAGKEGREIDAALKAAGVDCKDIVVKADVDVPVTAGSSEVVYTEVPVKKINE